MIVQVEEGKIKGVEKTSVLTGQTYCAFLGIPYAEPPIGDLRFKPPVPIKKWDGIHNAVEEGGECAQYLELTDPCEVIGTEDCLYLNVYTPEVPSKIQRKKAVMVYIHGGGFSTMSGSPRFYGPDFLIGYDIIYVTLNYRLHVFGFLNTGTPNCPGNAGLKDQLLALKWVKKNIASFGGDPENITLFGESAGGVSVHLHMLSPLSQGLFKRAIVQSGTALCPWAIKSDPEEQARKLGRLAGYTGQDLEGLIEHLKKQPARNLCEFSNQCFEDVKQNTPGRCSTLVFVPSVEKIKEGAFIPDLPEKLIQSAVPIPAIIGCTDQEGLLFFISQARGSMTFLLNNLSVAVKNNFQLDPPQQAKLVAKIKEFYFQNAPVTPKCVAPFINLYTDLYFMKFYAAFNNLIQSDVPPYIYLFTHDGKLNLFKNLVRSLADFRIRGAAHADDCGYLFSQEMVPIKIDEVDGKVIHNLCTLWTNFAKTGNPTSSLPHTDWRPHSTSKPGYLKIEESLRMFDQELFEKRLSFWEEWSGRFRR